MRTPLSNDGDGAATRGRRGGERTSDAGLEHVGGVGLHGGPAAEAGEDAHQVGRELDAGADEAEVGRRLVDVHVAEALLREGERAGQAAHA